MLDGNLAGNTNGNGNGDESWNGNTINILNIGVGN